jgi:N-acetylglucosamine kinase-like BadF-type ATPase
LPDHSQSSAAGVVAGVDVGGTKTHVAVVGSDGARADRVVASSVWRRGDLFSEADNLERLADEIRSALAGVVPARIVAGIHECDTPRQRTAAAAALSAMVGAPVLVANDTELLGWAVGRPSSIQLVVGTGANVLGRTDEGETVSALGNGWLLSDDGSAPALVRESLREMLRRADHGTLGDDPLAVALMARYEVDDLPGLAVRATRDASPTAWGRHAPVVFEAAADGSELARSVILEAGRRLADAVRDVIRRGARADVVVAAGGVIVNQSSLRDAFETALREQGCDLPVLVVTGPPVDGAIAWARSLTEPILFTQ